MSGDSRGHWHSFQQLGRDWVCVHCGATLGFVEDGPRVRFNWLAEARGLLATYMSEEGATSGQIAARLHSLIDAPGRQVAAEAWDEGHRGCSCDRPGAEPCRNPYAEVCPDA